MIKYSDKEFDEIKMSNKPADDQPFNHPTDWHHKEIHDRLEKLESQMNTIMSLIENHLNSEYAHQR